MSDARLYTVTFWTHTNPVEIDVRAHDEDEALRLARAATLLACEASIAEAS